MWTRGPSWYDRSHNTAGATYAPLARRMPAHFALRARVHSHSRSLAQQQMIRQSLLGSVGSFFASIMVVCIWLVFEARLVCWVQVYVEWVSNECAGTARLASCMPAQAALCVYQQAMWNLAWVCSSLGVMYVRLVGFMFVQCKLCLARFVCVKYEERNTETKTERQK